MAPHCDSMDRPVVKAAMKALDTIRRRLAGPRDPGFPVALDASRRLTELSSYFASSTTTTQFRRRPR
jgi:hypothetical protein